jgi:hypothetical protein
MFTIGKHKSGTVAIDVHFCFELAKMNRQLV